MKKMKLQMKTQMKNTWKNNFKHFHSVAWCESYKVFIPAWFQRSFFWNHVCFRQVIFRLDHAKCLQCVLDLLSSVNAMGDLQRLDFNKFSCGHVQWLTNGCLTYRLDLFHSLYATWDELHIRELWLGENFWVPAQPTLGTMPAFLTQGCGLSTPLYGDFEIRTLEGCCNSTDLETCWLAESLVWEFTRLQRLYSGTTGCYNAQASPPTSPKSCGEFPSLQCSDLCQLQWFSCLSCYSDVVSMFDGVLFGLRMVQFVRITRRDPALPPFT